MECSATDSKRHWGSGHLLSLLLSLEDVPCLPQWVCWPLGSDAIRRHGNSLLMVGQPQ